MLVRQKFRQLRRRYFTHESEWWVSELPQKAAQNPSDPHPCAKPFESARYRYFFLVCNPRISEKMATAKTIGLAAAGVASALLTVAVFRTLHARSSPIDAHESANPAEAAHLSATKAIATSLLEKKQQIAEVLSAALQLPTVSFETSDGLPASLVRDNSTLKDGPKAIKCTCGMEDHSEEQDGDDELTKSAREIATPEGLQASREAFLNLHALLEASFPKMHATLEKHVVNSYSLLYVWRPPPGTPPAQALALAAHMDVVPAADAAEWKYPPFSGKIADGKIYGRGAIDDKQAVIGICSAVEELLGRNFTPAVPIALLFGHDEELGGFDGASSLAAKLPEVLPFLPDGRKPISALLDEGLFLLSNFVPGMTGRVAAVCVAEKGAANMTITANQPASHSSAPSKSSSIGTLARAIAKIEDHQMPVHTNIAMRMFRAIVPQLPFIPAFLFSNDWLFGPVIRKILLSSPATSAMVRTTTAVTIVKGGYKSNVLPPEATVTINHRIHPNESVGFVQETYGKLLDGMPGVTFALTNRHVEPAPISSTTSTAYKAISASVRSVFEGKIAVAPSLMVGNTDTRWYWQLADNLYRHCPSELSIDEVGMFHGKNERIGKLLVLNESRRVHTKTRFCHFSSGVDNLARLGAFFAGVILRAAGPSAN